MASWHEPARSSRLPAVAFVVLCLVLPLHPGWALAGLAVLWAATPNWGRR